MWKVSRERIKIYPHPNADALELGRVGDYQVVVGKGQYSDGDVVVFAPKNSLLSGAIRDEFSTYLKGEGNNRVVQVRLRGEISEGIIIPDSLLVGFEFDRAIGKDISAELGIEQYLPPLPVAFQGTVHRYPDDVLTSDHDCHQFRTYLDEFSPNEMVEVTEKLHGSQIAITFKEGDWYVSSKGVHSRRGHILEAEGNVYWEALRNSGIINIVEEKFVEHPFDSVQLFGEVIPVQGEDWSYGQSKPTLRLFDMRVNGTRVAMPYVFDHLRVPLLYLGQYRHIDLDVICQGMEQVSGKELHIREGVVVSAASRRLARNGKQLFVKVINPEYAKKETGEELS